MKAYNEKKLPDNFSNKNVTWEYNPCSGYIFLTNSDNQVLLLNEDYDLEIQYLCPYCGFEGFKDELLDGESACCRGYLEELGVLEED